MGCTAWTTGARVGPYTAADSRATSYVADKISRTPRPTPGSSGQHGAGCLRSPNATRSSRPVRTSWRCRTKPRFAARHPSGPSRDRPIGRDSRDRRATHKTLPVARGRPERDPRGVVVRRRQPDPPSLRLCWSRRNELESAARRRTRSGSTASPGASVRFAHLAFEIHF